MDDKIIQFPKTYSSAEEALEMAKGWNFETVVIVGHTSEGGTAEGGLVICGSQKAEKEKAKDLLFLSTLLHWMGVKRLGFYD